MLRKYAGGKFKANESSEKVLTQAMAGRIGKKKTRMSILQWTRSRDNVFTFKLFREMGRDNQK
jgi:hypothetical protein